MKIITKNLKSALAIVPASVGIPPINCYRLEAIGGWLSVTGDNHDRRITNNVGCEGDLPALCVNSKHLIELVDFANGEIELMLDKGKLHFTSGDVKATLPTYEAEEFPAPRQEKLVPQGVNCEDLAELIKQAAWAASNDPAFYVFNSICVMGDGKALVACSSDKRNIAFALKPSICAEFQFLIPDKVRTQLVFALTQPNAVLFVSSNRVQVTYDFGQFNCVQIDGQFPLKACREMAFSEAAKIGWFMREELLSALSLCLAVCSSDYESQIHIECGKNGMVVSFRNKNGEEVSRNVSGKFQEAKISINAKTFSKCLSHFTAKDLLLEKADNFIRITVDELNVVHSIYKGK